MLKDLNIQVPNINERDRVPFEVRYPGRFTSLEEAEGAVQAMETVRTFIRAKLDLEETEESEDDK